MSSDLAHHLVLDREQLGAAAGDDAELIRELALLYITDSETNMVQLGRAVLGASCDDVQRFAHALKGASASLGAQEAAACFESLEAQARSGDPAPLPTLFEKTESAFARARDAFQQLAA